MFTRVVWRGACERAEEAASIKIITIGRLGGGGTGALSRLSQFGLVPRRRTDQQSS